MIRTYEQRDWEGICQAHDLARQQELSLANLGEAFLPLTVAAQREDLFEYEILVYEEAGTAVGFTAFTEDELAWLYVHPGYQRRGIGRQLAVAALERMAPGEQTVEVLWGNEPARALYRSLGFLSETVVSGVMPGNEGFNVTVYRMTKV